MENLLQRLLTGRNIAEQTQKLYEALNDISAVHELFNLISNCARAHIRQYAAIVLRKHFQKEETWRKYNSKQQQEFKDTILSATFSEKKDLVVSALARILVKMIQRSDQNFSNKVFCELWQNLSSSDETARLNASVVFVTLVECVPIFFEHHIKDVLDMTYDVLNAAAAGGSYLTMTPLHVLNGTSKLANDMSESDVSNIYTAALPALFQLLAILAKSNDEQHVDDYGIAHDVFEDFHDCAPQVLQPHLKRFVEFSLYIAYNAECEDAIRTRSIYALCWLVEKNLSAMNTLNLVMPIVTGVFELIVICTKEEIAKDMMIDDDESSILSAACDAIDTFANQIPCTELYPVLTELMKSAMQSPDDGLRRAAFMTLAVTVEGFSEIIKSSNHVSIWLNLIQFSVHDKSVFVRCAAFYALGQCSEYLQPEILKYSKEIMPVLLDFLNANCANVKRGDAEQNYVSLIFYALNYFCSYLNYNELEPHINQLMLKLFECVDPNTTAKNIREMVFESIRIITNKSGDKILPYMSQIITLLQPYLVKTCPPLEKEMRANAVYILEDLATAVGRQNFEPLVDDSIQLILMLLDDTEDNEDELAVVFSFCAEITDLFSEKAEAFMHKVIKCIFEVGLVRIFYDSDSDSIEMDEDDSDDDDEHDMTTNKLLCESMNALVSFCKNCGPQFKTYLNASFDKCFSLMADRSENVRQTAIDSCSEFVIELVNCEDDERQAIKLALNQFASRLIAMIYKEKNIETGVVIINALQTFVDSYRKLEKLDEPLINVLTEIIINGLKGDLECQDLCFCETENNSDNHLAFQTAITTLLCDLSIRMTTEEFLICFDQICPVLLKGNDENQPWPDDIKAISIYCMGSCVTALGKYSAKYYDGIFDLMFEGLSSNSPYIRRDAMCGLGELCFQVGPRSFASFPRVLGELSRLSQDSDASTVEMVCVTLARLILTNRTLVPLAEVMPMIVNNTPLKEHVRENLVIFECLKLLFAEERELFLTFFGEIIARGLDLIDNINKKKISEECHLTALQLVQELRKTYNEQFNMVLAANPQLHNIINF